MSPADVSQHALSRILRRNWPREQLHLISRAQAVGDNLAYSDLRFSPPESFN
jgi:hypothetical protein